MKSDIIKIGFQCVVDFYWRVGHATLEHELYSWDFLDWIKAGISSNMRGLEDPSRKIDFFASLYYAMIGNEVSENEVLFKRAVPFFYEDIFLLYQSHLHAQLTIAYRKGKIKTLQPSNLIIYPTFEKASELYGVLPSIQLSLEGYQAKHVDELEQKLESAYVSRDSMLFKSMSMMYDYGPCSENNGVLLGVT